MATAAQYAKWMRHTCSRAKLDGTWGTLAAYSSILELFEIPVVRGAGEESLSLQGGLINPNWPMFMQALNEDSSNRGVANAEPWWEGVIYLGCDGRDVAPPPGLMCPAPIRKSLGANHRPNMWMHLKMIGKPPQNATDYHPGYPAEKISHTYLLAMAGDAAQSVMLPDVANDAIIYEKFEGAVYATERALKLGSVRQREMLSDLVVNLSQMLTDRRLKGFMLQLHKAVEASVVVPTLTKAAVEHCWKSVEGLPDAPSAGGGLD